MPDGVRCKDCGFLGIRKTGDREIVEVELQIRETGDFPYELQFTKGDMWADQQYHYEPRPICFMREPEFLAETQREISPGDREAQFTNVIRRERNCDSFTPWKQGNTPKEHSEMLERQLMLDWQDKRDEADRTWREQQAREDRAWRAEESKLARQANRTHFWEIVIIASISIAVGIAGVVAQIYTTKMQIDAQAKDSRNSPPH